MENVVQLVDYIVLLAYIGFGFDELAKVTYWYKISLVTVVVGTAGECGLHVYTGICNHPDTVAYGVVLSFSYTLVARCVLGVELLQTTLAPTTEEPTTEAPTTEGQYTYWLIRWSILH